MKNLRMHLHSASSVAPLKVADLHAMCTPWCSAVYFMDHVSNVFLVWMMRDMTSIRYGYISYIFDVLDLHLMLTNRK